MNIPFITKVDASTICIFLCIGMILFFALGRLLRNYWKLGESDEKGSIGMLQTGLFGLFGFILAFTFGMSGNRYDNIRRSLIEESNSIGTAILRSDLYSDSVRTTFRKYFREYLEGRIGAYKNVRDSVYTLAVKRSTNEAANNLWSLAMSESKQPNMLIPSNQMIPALNNMFDASTERDTLLRSNVPEPIVYMLLVLGLVTAFIAGATCGVFGRREWIIISCFILFNTMIVYITLDLGRPLRGMIKARAADNALKEVRSLLNY
jgi:hypothetical protein